MDGEKQYSASDADQGQGTSARMLIMEREL
jgi:hypothetical protein